MVRFAHIADVHLGGWKQPPMQELNFKSFVMAIDACIKEKVEFVVIAGDLFDTAFPGIDVLKDAFGEFKKLKDAKIPCFIIAGSHDYSVSGKTFLDVLEKAGFCKNVGIYEETPEKIILNPTIYKGVAFYGYPGRKSGLEVDALRKVKFNDTPGMFKIFLLHTTLDKAKGLLPIDAIESASLPKADYYALGHLHIDYQYENFVYPGPIFPNNFQELEDLRHGSFYIVDTESTPNLKKVELKIKEVLPVEIEIKNAIRATEKTIAHLKEKEVEDKVVLLRFKGEIESGSNSDIKFQEIEDYLKQKGAYFFLKNTHDLKNKDLELDIEITKGENIEEEAINSYSGENPSDFNKLIPNLVNTLSIEKQEGETGEGFSIRILEGAKKIFNF
ncbi:MAG: DNA repair exonuclease [Nanoarchaeota archaeon]